MTPLLWTLVAATILVYISKAPMNFITIKAEGYDNHHPRLQHQTMKGAGHRAWAAHQNTIEAYPMFAAGVLVSQFSQADPYWSLILGILFLVARVVFIALYLLDQAFLRSTSWAVGYGSTLGLMVLPFFS